MQPFLSTTLALRNKGRSSKKMVVYTRKQLFVAAHCRAEWANLLMRPFYDVIISGEIDGL